MTTVYINCGGETAQNFQGDNTKFIKSDNSFAHKERRKLSGLPELQSEVLRSHRWSESSFRYEIPVTSSGKYEVELWFAEVFDGAFGKDRRVFSVQLKGDGDAQAVKSGDIDVYALVGSDKLLSRKYSVSVEKAVTIDFMKGSANNPMVSAITVRPVDRNIDYITSDSKYPTAEELDRTKKKIDDYAQKIRDSGIRNRGGNYPYYLFHPATYEPHGTVLFFHGFSGGPYGQRILAHYLYKNGFNIVSGLLAGHAYYGDDWPQVNVKGGKDLQEKLKKDPTVQNLLAGGDGNTRPRFFGISPGVTQLSGGGEITPEGVQKLFGRARELGPKLKEVSFVDYVKAINDDKDPKFDEIFDSTHMDYLKSGQEQLDLLNELPGEVYTCGLSVGASVALAVAAANPGRVTRCFSAAPLLEIYERAPNTTRMVVNIIGPLGIREFAWDPKNPFPMACLTANGRFGGYITTDEKGIETFRSGKCKLFLCLTEMEDAADIPTNRKYFQDIGGKENGHDFFIYPRGRNVPHPFIDPTQQSQGTSNKFYRSLYAEIYRFLRGGRVKTANLDLMEVKEEGIPEAPEGVAGWAFYRDL